MFEIFREMNPEGDMAAFTDAFDRIGFFESGMAVSDAFGSAYSGKKKTEYVPCNPQMPQEDNLLDRRWSPSALEIYFSCPREFYLSYVRNISVPETDNPLQVINFKDIGTLAHMLMEQAAFSEMTRDEFMKKAEETYDDFLLTRPPVLDIEAEKSKRDFMSMMGNAYDTNPGNKVVSAEKDSSCAHESGVLLHGFPDRIEQLPDGSYIIADYKTKMRIEHVKDDIDTCLQVVVYAYIAEKAGYNIKECEYRYIRYGDKVTCAYDEDMKNRLNAKMLEFRNALETGSFPQTADANNCKYCRLNKICGFEENSGKGGDAE